MKSVEDLAAEFEAEHLAEIQAGPEWYVVIPCRTQAGAHYYREIVQRVYRLDAFVRVGRTVGSITEIARPR